MPPRRSERKRIKTSIFTPDSSPATTRKTTKSSVKKGLSETGKLLIKKPETTIKDRKIKDKIEYVINKNKQSYIIGSKPLDLDNVDEVKNLLKGIDLGIDEVSNINMIILFAKYINRDSQYDLSDQIKFDQLCDIVKSVLKKPKYNWAKKIYDIRKIREKRINEYKIFTNHDRYKQHIKDTISKNMQKPNISIPLNLNNSKQVQLVLSGVVHQGCKTPCRNIIIYFAKYINNGNHIYNLKDESKLDIFCDIVWNIVKPAKEQHAIAIPVKVITTKKPVIGRFFYRRGKSKRTCKRSGSSSDSSSSGSSSSSNSSTNITIV
tara:strand:+ start:300 stop:1259 length:960 start_codon:yes stop_codon:yes gene_type:complete